MESKEQTPIEEFIKHLKQEKAKGIIFDIQMLNELQEKEQQYAQAKVLEALDEVEQILANTRGLLINNKEGLPFSKRELEFITLHIGMFSEKIKTEVKPKYY